MAKFTDETTLLVQGIKGKINQEGRVTDQKLIDDLLNLVNAFKTIVFEK